MEKDKSDVEYEDEFEDIEYEGMDLSFLVILFFCAAIISTAIYFWKRPKDIGSCSVQGDIICEVVDKNTIKLVGVTSHMDIHINWEE